MRARKLKNSFPPISTQDAFILVLGSMPGEVSLQKSQYYAHPGNIFWKIMCIAAGIDLTASYSQRVEILKAKKVALWDVLKQCEREGSLDSSIKRHSEEANNLIEFLTRHPKVEKICFNGQKALNSFNRHILKANPDLQEKYRLVLLPSTSPANASIPYETKYNIWVNEVWAAGSVAIQKAP